MPILLTLAMMNKLNPLTNFEVMNSIDSHISFTGITACDLIYSRLFLLQKVRLVCIKHLATSPVIEVSTYHIKLHLLLLVIRQRRSAGCQEVFLVLGQCCSLETVQ